MKILPRGEISHSIITSSGEINLIRLFDCWLMIKFKIVSQFVGEVFNDFFGEVDGRHVDEVDGRHVDEVDM